MTTVDQIVIIMFLSISVSVLSVLYFISSLLIAVFTNLYPFIAFDLSHNDTEKTENVDDRPISSLHNNTFISDVPKLLWDGLYINEGIAFIIGNISNENKLGMSCTKLRPAWAS